MLTAPTTSVRVVLTPEAVVVAEARRTLTSLALYGYRVDALVANRVFPPARTSRSWPAGPPRRRSSSTGAGRRGRRCRCWCRPTGARAGRPARLTVLGQELYGDHDPSADAAGAELVTVGRTTDGFELSLALPLAQLDDLQLSRTGDELVVTVAGPPAGAGPAERAAPVHRRGGRPGRRPPARPLRAGPRPVDAIVSGRPSGAGRLRRRGGRAAVRRRRGLGAHARERRSTPSTSPPVRRPARVCPLCPGCPAAPGEARDGRAPARRRRVARRRCCARGGPAGAGDEPGRPPACSTSTSGRG